MGKVCCLVTSGQVEYQIISGIPHVVKEEGVLFCARESEHCACSSGSINVLMLSIYIQLSVYRMSI